MSKIVLTRGERFKDARTVHNKNGKQTIPEVAKITSISESMISDLENDEKNRGVRFEAVAALARHYGVTADFLLGLEESPFRGLDISSAIKYTGLSTSAVKRLHQLKNKTAYISSINEIIEDHTFLTALSNYLWLFSLNSFFEGQYRFVPLKNGDLSRYHKDVFFAAIIRELPTFAARIESKFINDKKVIDSLHLDYCIDHFDEKSALAIIGEDFDGFFSPDDLTTDDWEDYYSNYCENSEEEKAQLLAQAYLDTEEQISAVNTVFERLSEIKKELASNGID